MEFYPRDNKNPKNFLSIDVCMPITKEGEQYVISSYPKPEYKKGIENTDSKKEDWANNFSIKKKKKYIINIKFTFLYFYNYFILYYSSLEIIVK